MTLRAMVIGLCLAAVACQQPVTPTRVERTVFLMGTLATFVVESLDRPSSVERLDQMVRLIEETEADLSTWREDSLLSQFNRQPVGTWLNVPRPVCSVLNQVAYWHEETDGAFDPVVGALMEAWSLRGDGRQPNAEELAVARARSGFHHVRIDSENCALSRAVDAAIDAGGFGKGAALDRVRQATRDEPGSWLIDFGGQVAVSSNAGHGGWSIAVAHPEFRDVPILELDLDEGSVATTGGSERDIVTANDVRLGHVIDPRTGQTVSRPGSVTVWHHDALVADMLSTALYVMDAQDAVRWSEARGIAAYFADVNPETGVVDRTATEAFSARFLSE